MSVIGFDIGNESCVIATARRGAIDILLNDEAKRETPSVVSFGNKQRFLGSAGAAFATSNPKSTISQIKRLIGRLFKEPSVQEDLKLLPFVTSESPRGGILIEIEYLNTKWFFTPVEILAMLIKHLKQIAEKTLESLVEDCVIGIPSYFTDLQRREYLDAARIAGLTPLRLIHDGTAIALGYGMYKTDFAKSGKTVVVFVDIGHCDTQVTVAAFAQGEMKILSHSFDLNLGGRDFDEVLFRHFAAQFEKNYKIDVYSNPHACIRLRAACEKVKKVLSANAEAPISIECLIDDTDVRGVIKREEFEKLSEELLHRVNIPCIQAVEDSGVSVDKIYTIELVGSGSRIPAITKVLTLFFNKEPTRTLNASECVARGCAIRCAMLSPAVKVRDYQVYDIYPYSIALPFDEAKNNLHQELVLFPKGSPYPSNKKLIHNGRTKFSFQLLYSNKMEFPVGVSRIIGHFQIGLHEYLGAENLKVEFNMMLNVHGIVEVESASAAPRNFGSLMEMMVGNSRPLILKFSENFDVSITKEELHEAQVREQLLAEQDKKVEENKDERNTLKSFVYDTRSKLSNAYRSFATEFEKKVITKHLQEIEDWLYEDSDDESEQDYTGKLDVLKKVLDPIENKYKYAIAKLQATKALQTCISEYRTLAESLPLSLKQQFNDECIKVQQHVNDNSPENGDEWPNFIKNTLDDFASRPLSVTFFENYDVATTKEELHEAQVREQKLADQDKKVEENKDQRKTLSKLSKAYRSFATELDKKVITDHLQETEDWLYEDSDDKSEQDYTGKLNVLKKLLDPIENKYKYETAKLQATKALQTRIAEYHTLADSLPLDQKQQFNDECISVQQYVNDNPPENGDEWPNFMENSLNIFARRCKAVFSSTPSYPNQREKHVDPNQREKHVDPNQREKHVDTNQREKQVDPNQREKHMEPNHIDNCLELNRRDEQVNPTQRAFWSFGTDSE